jgi:hypothetical protein
MESRERKERRQVREEKRGKVRTRGRRRTELVDGMKADCRVTLGQIAPGEVPYGNCRASAMADMRAPSCGVG